MLLVQETLGLLPSSSAHNGTLSQRDGHLATLQSQLVSQIDLSGIIVNLLGTSGGIARNWLFTMLILVNYYIYTL